MNRSQNVIRPKHPHNEASRISKMCFWWLKDIFKMGVKQPITDKDVYQVLDTHKSEKIINEFSEIWDEELKKEDPSVISLFYKMYGFSTIIIGLLFSLCETLVRCIQPQFLGALISFFVSTDSNAISQTEAYLYALGIVMCSLIPVITFHPFIYYIFGIGMKLRIGSSGLIYKKILKLSKSATIDGLNGRVINLMSNDLGKFDVALCFLHDLWKGPLEVILLGYFIYREVGFSGFVGIIFILSFIPIQSWMGKKAAQFRLKTTKRTDTRVRFMNEIIQGIQIIKMYTWENSFAKMIAEIRRKEMNGVRGSLYILALLMCMWAVSRVSVFISLVSYVFTGNVITARKVYIITSYYHILNESMVHFWPLAITFCAEGYISMKRLREFLTLSEKKPDVIEVNHQNKDEKEKENGKVIYNKISNGNGLQMNGGSHVKSFIKNTEATHKGIVMKNVTANWVSQLGINSIGVESLTTKIEPGKLCVIIGAVGSGKSSFLQILLGELEMDSGVLEINGGLSYASQEAWLFEGSIKNNIVFVEEYDEKRYNEVVRVCALERDFELLPNGDETVVGERGISLSGGQKARVNLARAVYKNCDIYLLDDPLSAVDTHVGKHIFKECIQTFLADKVVVLVTHQLQILNNVQHVILMNEGQIKCQGPYKELADTHKDSLLLLSPQEAPQELDVANEKFKKLIEKAEFIPTDDDKETFEVGSIKWSVYKRYLQAIQSVPLVVFVIVLKFIVQFIASTGDFFVAQWVNWEESVGHKISTNMLLEDVENRQLATSYNITGERMVELEGERKTYVMVYSILMGLLVIFIVQAEFSFFYACIRASRNLHDYMFRGVTNTFMKFFSSNPSGRILNRFSKDMGNVDTTLPNVLFDCSVFVLEITAVLTLVAIVNFWFIVPTLVMLSLLLVIRYYYVHSSRSIKRVESLTRSPIFAHVNATLQGLATVRSCNAESKLVNEFMKIHLDSNTTAYFLFYSVTRAFAFWLDLLCVTYVAIVTFTFVYMGNEVPGGNVGLAITQVISLVFMCQWGMRQTAELENQMVSVERVIDYANLPSEQGKDAKKVPPKEWPVEGNVEFENLSLSYSKNSETVLKNLNFSIKSNEKIGIVGRTGAGKSSIIQALFRLAPIEGDIKIGGLNTSELNLNDLRQKISIIPQDPTLFSGTLRSNLDPFDEHTDESLWNVINHVEMQDSIDQLAGGLEGKVNDGGSNFSMGQRQLICLARALLRENKILILDEATANVDPATDHLIQKTIRDKFSDCTVVTIAHRLHTVMDNDKILVMDAGNIVEFAHPYELIKNENGHLRNLIDQTGPSTASMLIDVAKQNYDKKLN